MKNCFFLLLISISNFCFSQNELPTKSDILRNASEKACECIDSLNSSNKNAAMISSEIGDCIDEHTSPYYTAGLLIEASERAKKENLKNVNIEWSPNKNSEAYKSAYYEIETYLNDNCDAIRRAISSNDLTSYKSISDNPKARDFYNLGIDASNSQDYEKAVKYYEKAVKEDYYFPFAWDNIGLCYRKLGNYEKALEAYETSLKIDPTGKMPLQNIPVTYQYLKQYQKAIDAYKRLQEIYPEDPEVDYGIGLIYFEHLNNNEKALDEMCKAYVKYTNMRSPYRSDAETYIKRIYTEMSKEGKTDMFNKILENNKINTNNK